MATEREYVWLVVLREFEYCGVNVYDSPEKALERLEFLRKKNWPEGFVQNDELFDKDGNMVATIAEEKVL